MSCTDGRRYFPVKHREMFGNTPYCYLGRTAAKEQRSRASSVMVALIAVGLNGMRLLVLQPQIQSLAEHQADHNRGHSAASETGGI
jgi:hypothetical protein